jgi:hypothetical protein
MNRFTPFWQAISSAIEVLGGLVVAVVGVAAIDSSAHTWPTILVAIGIYTAAAGIHGRIL